jgi:hypothetical protein
VRKLTVFVSATTRVLLVSVPPMYGDFVNRDVD